MAITAPPSQPVPGTATFNDDVLAYFAWFQTSQPQFNALATDVGLSSAAAFGVVGDGTTDDSAALQDFVDDCATNNRRGVLIGTYNVGSTTITDRTGGLIDWSQATLKSTYGGQYDALLDIAPATADVFASDATLQSAVETIIAAGEWQRGKRILAGLGPHAGKTVRVASNALLIDRQGGDAGDYRLDVTFEILDSEGALNAALPFDIPAGTVLSVVEGQTVRPQAIVNMPTVKLEGGTTNRTGELIRISRSNTVARGGYLIDDGGAEHGNTGRIFKATSVVWEDSTFHRAVEHGTAYGIGVAFASGVSLVRMRGSGAKRQLNADYVHALSLIDCNCPDGAVGHLHGDVQIMGGHYGCDDPGLYPIHIAGADVTVTGATLTRKGVGAIVSTRNGLFELRGSARLIDCNITIDLSDVGAGNADCALVQIESPDVAHDFGRDVYFPELIELWGNRTMFLGTTATPRALLLDVDGTRNDDGGGDDIILDTDLIVGGNSFHQESGAEVEVRLAGTRQTNWEGAGLRARIRDLRNLTVFWGSVSGHATDTAARASWDIDIEGPVTMNTDFEATKDYRINCHEFTSGTAVGATSAVGDEQWWHSIRGGSPMQKLAIADNGVFVLGATRKYERYEVWQINASTTAVLFGIIADHAGTNAPNVVIQEDLASGTIAQASVALTGTTGTDGNITVGNAADVLYIENRSGSTFNCVLMKMGATT